jgi:sugar lactone lactonase YvrE
LKKSAIVVLVLVLLAAGGSIAYLRREHEPHYKPTPPGLTGRVTTLAGTGAPQVIDGPTGQAAFADPFGIAVDRAGNVLVSEGGKSNRIRRVSPKGIVDTLASASEDPHDRPPISGSNDRVTLDTPSAIAVDKSGNLIIADTSDNRIVRLSPKGEISVAAGGGAKGYRDGSASEAQFDSPIGVAADDAGNIFVADTYNDRIRKISPDGQVSTVAGSGTPGAQDGNGLAASFDTPCGVAVDKAGNIFVADAENNSIRKITPDSTVTLFAGGARGRQDGKGPDATFDHPCGITITHDGFLFVSDESSGLIREITPDADVTTVAGSAPGFRNSTGKKARFNGPSGIAVDPAGNLYVADRDNYLIRKIVAASSPAEASQSEFPEDKLFQPVPAGAQSVAEPMTPNLSPDVLGIKDSFPWPLNPQDKWHEIAGVVGEARGAFGGVALDHLHSGLDVKGAMGEQALAVLDETVSSPIPNWGFNETGEGIHVGVVSYIHVRIGRDVKQAMLGPDKFKPRLDKDGKLVGVRVRRGAEFKVGDAVGSLNAMNHVHLNLGPWNAQANPIRFPFIGFKDTVAPAIESSGGIEVVDSQGRPFSQKRGGRLVISGDVSIIVAAYDRVDGNAPARKLGLYRAGYQILNEDGAPAPGFEEPLMNIDFSRLPADDSSVFVTYAPGSGVSAYGTPTKFRYIVTNVVKDGRATQGVFRTSALAPGNYVLKAIAEDYAGNAASGKDSLLPILIENGRE